MGADRDPADVRKGAAEPIDAVVQEAEVPAQLRHRFRGPVGLDQAWPQELHEHPLPTGEIASAPVHVDNDHQG